jgi:ABC-2 type transport system ATP-binding protein
VPAASQLSDRGERAQGVAGLHAHLRSPIVEVEDVWRSFGARRALAGVSLRVSAGEIQGLLGPNGAGKTTLLRILSGLTEPTSGRVRVLGADATGGDRALRQRIGLVPSGDRSFYLRISGLENLLFFGRLHGLSRRGAVRRAREVLDLVGLADVGRVPAGEYSHGMQKRLSVARALLTSPALLLVDEATHDLDPLGARLVRELIAELAVEGTAVVWATQRVDEIRGFVDGVIVLDRGVVRFEGSVAELMARSACRRYLLHLRDSMGHENGAALAESLVEAGRIVRAPDGAPEHFLLTLDEEVVLGEALARLTAAGIEILSCREERSQIEEAFIGLTDGAAR